MRAETRIHGPVCGPANLRIDLKGLKRGGVGREEGVRREAG